MIDFKKATTELLRGISQMIENRFKQTTKVYNGQLIKSATGGKWQVRFNGEIHEIPQYGEFKVAIGKVVKVIVPQGNINLAYFI